MAGIPMDKITLSLHTDLAAWLNAIAVKRGLSLHEAVHQLLEEERMRSLGVTKIEVPIGDCRWQATIPMRGLLYTDYETHWQRVDSGGTAVHT
jgi:hypothetical protein